MKNVRSFTKGAPTVPENWFSSSGTSAGLTTVSVVGVEQVATDGGQKPSVPNVFACQAPGRVMYSPSPRRLLVPDFVTMFSAGPAVQPYSAENALERTEISCTAPSGTVAIDVWRPHPSS